MLPPSETTMYGKSPTRHAGNGAVASAGGTVLRGLAIAFVASFALGACSTSRSYVQVRHVAQESNGAEDQASIASGASFSRYSRELLAKMQLRWQPESCKDILQTVADSPLSLASRLFLLTELTLAAAESRKCAIPRETLLLNAARLAYGQLLIECDEDPPPPESLLIAFYNRAVGKLLADGRRGTLADRASALGIGVEPESAELAARFDRVIDADTLAFTGLLARHRRNGLGVALVGVITEPPVKWRHARAVDGGYAQAITALLHFGVDGEVSLQVLDAAFAGFIAGDRYFSLHADFTAPYAWQLGHSRLSARESRGAFSPARVASDRGLLLLEPFDPRKIPVLMIHGFWSSPQAWRNVTNEILATAELRDRFQVWHYFYPTGINYLYSAGALHAELAAFVAELRSAHGHDAVQPLVVIGHSQGGLLARSLVACSGWALWDTVFRVPPDSLAASPEARAAFRRTLIYEPLPDVDTIVLMATPNGGTRSIRNSLRALLLNALTDLPDETARALRTLGREHPEQLRAHSRRWFARGGMTALESMAPDNPLMTVFGRLPLGPQVHVHSIVAVRRTAAGVGDGDEFISRASAHVPNAESELTVVANHQDIDGVSTIAEIQRILRLRAWREP